MELLKKLSQWLLVLTAGVVFSLSLSMADDDDWDDDDDVEETSADDSDEADDEDDEEDEDESSASTSSSPAASSSEKATTPGKSFAELEEAAKKLAGEKLGFWVSGNASVSTFGYVRRDDARNRILCMLTLTYGTDCFYSGDFKETPQLVHVQKDGKKVTVEEANDINAEAGGIYVLFMPETLYVLNFDDKKFVRYAKRK